jgi:hypothetical protein
MKKPVQERKHTRNQGPCVGAAALAQVRGGATPVELPGQPKAHPNVGFKAL